MNYYQITIQYAGSYYAGFQFQNGLSTVQGEINKALSKIIDDKFTTVGASRTDTGVHAFDQIVKITTENEIELSTFIDKLNPFLPDDILCVDINLSDGLFRPSASSISKEYRYFFTNNVRPNPANRQFIANISNKLNIEAIQICINAMLGTHDFCQFYSSGSNVKSTIRTLNTCELTCINPQKIFLESTLFSIPHDLDQCFQLRIEANGFLKQMIRHFVSALWMVGSGKLTVTDFLNLLNNDQASSKQLWKVAPPNGLFLYKINY